MKDPHTHTHTLTHTHTHRHLTHSPPPEPPPVVTASANVTVSPGSTAVLTCGVVSTVRFNLTWLRRGLDARLDPRVCPLANLSLEVRAVAVADAGWYECVAVNEGGATVERVYLSVQGETGSETGREKRHR